MKPSRAPIVAFLLTVAVLAISAQDGAPPRVAGYTYTAWLREIGPLALHRAAAQPLPTVSSRLEGDD